MKKLRSQCNLDKSTISNQKKIFFFIVSPFNSIINTNRIFLVTKNSLVHHLAIPMLKSLIILLILVHHSSQICDRIRHMALKKFRCRSDIDGLLGHGYLKVTHLKDSTKWLSARRELKKVSLKKEHSKRGLVQKMLTKRAIKRKTHQLSDEFVEQFRWSSGRRPLSKPHVTYHVIHHVTIPTQRYTTLCAHSLCVVWACNRLWTQAFSPQATPLDKQDG